MDLVVLFIRRNLFLPQFQATFSFPGAHDSFPVIIRNAPLIQLSSEMRRSPLQSDTLLKTFLTTCSGAVTIISESQGFYRFSYHPRTAVPSTSREQSLNRCSPSLPHTDGAGKGKYALMNRVVFIHMIEVFEGERGNHAMEPRWPREMQMHRPLNPVLAPTAVGGSVTIHSILRNPSKNRGSFKSYKNGRGETAQT